jgi:hypothetical protein
MTVGALSIAACNVSDYQVKPAPQGPGMLILQNGAPSAGPVDITIDGATVATAVSFPDTIRLTGVPYGQRVLAMFATGTTSNPLFSGPIFISTSRRYDEILGGNVGGGGYQFLGGQVSAASVGPASNAGLRIYDAIDQSDVTDAQFQGNVDITLTGTSTSTTVTTPGVTEFNSAPAFTNGQTAAGYQSLPPDTYSLVVVNSDDPADTLLQGVSITLTAGQLRTATLAGRNPAGATVQLLPVLADSGQ